MDFYLVLPSNACANLHPNNTASKFFVSFNETINTSPNDAWKVALTEMHFNDVLLTLNTGHGIEYVEMESDLEYRGDMKIIWRAGHFEVQWPSHIGYVDGSGKLQHFNVGDFHIETDKRVVFYNPTKKFTVTFKRSGKVLGFNEVTYTSTYDENSHGYYVRADKNHAFKEEEVQEFVITMTYFLPPTPRTKKFNFQQDIRFNTEADLISYLQKEIQFLFSNITGGRGNVIEMTINNSKREITQVKFLNGLNIILGIRELVHKIDKNNAKIKGNSKCILDGGITKFLVYTSVCAPVQVGDVRVPLLKMVSFNTNKKGYQNITFKNPMYLPVSQETINSVEVNIRSDSGELIPFIPGSVTTLTLHFKRERYVSPH